MSRGENNMGKLIAYRKTYRLRTAVPGRKTIEVTFPFEVIEKEARSKGLTVAEFLNRFQAVCEYDSFDGVLYTFEKIEGGLQRHPLKLSEEGNGDGKRG